MVLHADHGCWQRHKPHDDNQLSTAALQGKSHSTVQNSQEICSILQVASTALAMPHLPVERLVDAVSPVTIQLEFQRNIGNSQISEHCCAASQQSLSCSVGSLTVTLVNVFAFFALHNFQLSQAMYTCQECASVAQ
jgi:hypothetical protein